VKQLNQLTNRVGGGRLRFKGHLDEPGTVTVAGSPPAALRADTARPGT